MTIICGPNNTGKTYATYALYGFLSFWKEGFSIEATRNSVQELIAEITNFNIKRDDLRNEADITDEHVKERFT